MDLDNINLKLDRIDEGLKNLTVENIVIKQELRNIKLQIDANRFASRGMQMPSAPRDSSFRCQQHVLGDRTIMGVVENSSTGNFQEPFVATSSGRRINISIPMKFEDTACETGEATCPFCGHKADSVIKMVAHFKNANHETSMKEAIHDATLRYLFK